MSNRESKNVVISEEIKYWISTNQPYSEFYEALYWFSMIRALRIEGYPSGIYTTDYYDILSKCLKITKQTFRRKLSLLEKHNLLIFHKRGFKLNKKPSAKPQHIGYELALKLKPKELYIRQLIDKLNNKERYYNTDPYSTSSDSKGISRSYLSIKSGLKSESIAKIIQNIERNHLLKVNRRFNHKEGVNYRNKYKIVAEGLKTVKTVKKKPKKKNSKRKPLIIHPYVLAFFLNKDNKEKLIKFDVLNYYYLERNIPKTHYLNLINRLFSKTINSINKFGNEHWLGDPVDMCEELLPYVLKEKTNVMDWRTDGWIEKEKFILK